ncbi:Hypothetical protein Eab7_2481 [Exiguobacterium antarcticum B7]|nr:Hypothetical protein Eab7_2481 [Exiguobacterium antarcticum B7]
MRTVVLQDFIDQSSKKDPVSIDGNRVFLLGSIATILF